MALGDRSISVVLQDIIANVQEIVRSEVRLAKTEIREEVATARPWAQMLGAGAVAALFAILFVLLMIVHALALIMPMWAASLSAGAALAMSAKKHTGENPMGQTTGEIISHIDETRHDLGDNLDELEQKVKSVTDWRQHFQTKPMTLLGVAFGGGILLSMALAGSRSKRIREYAAASGSAPYMVSPRERHKALETWDNIKGALIGVAATRFTDFVDQVVPGFNKHYQTASEKGRAAQHSRGTGNASTLQN